MYSLYSTPVHWLKFFFSDTTIRTWIKSKKLCHTSMNWNLIVYVLIRYCIFSNVNQYTNMILAGIFVRLFSQSYFNHINGHVCMYKRDRGGIGNICITLYKSHEFKFRWDQMRACDTYHTIWIHVHMFSRYKSQELYNIKLIYYMWLPYTLFQDDSSCFMNIKSCY